MTLQRVGAHTEVLLKKTLAKYHLKGSLQKRKSEARYEDTRPMIETGISELLVPSIIDKPGPTRQIILQP